MKLKRGMKAALSIGGAVGLVGVLGIASVYGFYRLASPRWKHWEEFKAGDMLIGRVRDWNEKHGSFPPEDLVNRADPVVLGELSTELALFIVERSNLRYRRIGKGFVVDLSVGFDDWFSFDSRENKWSCE